ncbi:histidine kinase [Winogradskyella litoriviva]|uniref:histidine kinase n=1 Tax=Winogradskyella litoriviva TaxID=1220182 RepID=A0ABX2E5K0_9FLAO|nr:histidine kinase [Winogradskyella litoriviva]NRD23776.1 histidine kinase [Winogradskyella litoriviva]
MLYFWISLSSAYQKTISNEEIALISYVIFITLTLVTAFVLFFVVFQKRKNQLLINQVKQQQKFDEELIKTQQEIQDETIKHIGRELHDNIGQMLVMSTMQMNAAVKVVDNDAKTKVSNAAETLKSTLDEVRALSKSLNSDVIFNLGFQKTVKNEIHRLNKTGLLEASVSIIGEKVDFENKKDEIILFRILQEFFSNTLKYAEADQLKITIDYQEKVLSITAEDNGIGFNIKTAEKSSGLINMEKRAELLNADFQLESRAGKGTILTLKYPYKSA